MLVVAVTGFGQEHDTDAATRAGFDAHVVKLADSRSLARLLSECGSTRIDDAMA